MAPIRSTLSALVLLLLLPYSFALKFDLLSQSAHAKAERCVRNFVNRDTLVVVTTIIDGFKGDGQIVNMHVR